MVAGSDYWEREKLEKVQVNDIRRNNIEPINRPN